MESSFSIEELIEVYEALPKGCPASAKIEYKLAEAGVWELDDKKDIDGIIKYFEGMKKVLDFADVSKRVQVTVGQSVALGLKIKWNDFFDYTDVKIEDGEVLRGTYIVDTSLPPEYYSLSFRTLTKPKSDGE